MKTMLAALLLLASGPAISDDVKADLPAWMTGAWERIDGEKWADEFWTPPKAGIMIGASRSGNGEKLLFWEHMRVVREDEGKLAFWAIAADQRPVRFGAVRAGESEIVFENPAHDYPQRIRYWREDRKLNAQISLMDGSKTVDFSFDMMGG
jgi:Domain of unknown function (DUF6265)